MKLKTPLLRYIVAAIIVVVLGGLGGWYMFINKQIDSTEAQDTARGYGASETFGDGIGSTINNLVGDVIGGILGNDKDTNAASAPKLWQITRTPVAGHGFASSSPRLYFAERASGNILLADPTTTNVQRLTNTLIPKVLEAYFANDGSVVLRSLSDDGEIQSYAARIATSTSPAAGDTPNKLEGAYLPGNIVSMGARSTPNELFFLVRENSGSAGIVSNWLGGNQKRTLVSALSDWQTIFLQDGTKYLIQKASDDVAGYAFKITGAGSLERVIGDLPGLIILPRKNSQAMLFSTASAGQITLFARANSQTADVRLAIRTLAEKCVWAPDTRLIAYCAVPQTAPSGTILRDRYDGSAHTADAWWRVDVSANTAEQIYTPEISVALDVENPQIDGAGTHIAFMNAADKTLWMLTLNK
jgi:hypothetical protein